MSQGEHDHQRALGVFFEQVQLKAIRQAQFAVGSFHEAEDLVQDAMVRLNCSYADRPHEWEQLFHRILQNLIRDWYRKAKVRQGVMWLFSSHDDDESLDAVAPNKDNPDAIALNTELSGDINDAIQALPIRQQQAFLLRTWWHFDTRETARVMGCGEGSVKTHYHRAIAKLRVILQEAPEGK